MAHLKVKLGDILYLTESPDGGFPLTAHNPEFARQMSRAEEIMHDDRAMLRQPPGDEPAPDRGRGRLCHRRSPSLGT